MKAEIDISFNQLLNLVRGLDDKRKKLLAEELEKSVISDRLSKVLDHFRGIPISQEEINEASEAVRSEIYNESISDKSHR